MTSTINVDNIKGGDGSSVTSIDVAKIDTAEKGKSCRDQCNEASPKDKLVVSIVHGILPLHRA